VSTTLRQAVLADPHPVWLDAIANMLRGGEIEVLARSSPGSDALAVLEEIHPDLLVTEIATGDGGLDGPAYIRAARTCSPDTKVVVLAAEDEMHVVRDVLLAGASAYVVKTAQREDLLVAVRQAFDTTLYMVPAEVLEGLPEPSGNGSVRDAQLERLTRREMEVLRLVAEGLTNAQLARMLWLSEQTVKFHLSSIYRKLGVGNRTEASRWAQLHGALEGVENGSENGAGRALVGAGRAG
jgi:DNA-binding NarL/FixJ family response regulator